MSLVSAFSHTLVDKCEAERNQTTLAAVKPLGDAHLKCCIQMYHSLALMTHGSVSNPCPICCRIQWSKSWRLIHSRHGPDTQNRQYALMQKVIMPVRLEMEQVRMMTAGRKSTLPKKGKRKGEATQQNQKGTRTNNTRNTDISTCKNCGRTGHRVTDCWRQCEGAYDDSQTTTTTIQNTGKNNKKGKGKGKRWTFLPTSPPSETVSTLSYPSPDTEHG